MLETWNTCIYEVLQQKLLDSAIKLIQSDRCGQLIDSSLVIGISESCGKFGLLDFSVLFSPVLFIQISVGREQILSIVWRGLQSWRRRTGSLLLLTLG